MIPVAGVACFAPVAYEGPARALVRGLKFRAALDLTRAMAAPIAACAPRGMFADAALVPAPLVAVRRRARGFNQAAALAVALAARTGRPVDDCLRRRGPPGSQVGRGRTGRQLALTGAVSCRGRAPERAVLVDDVITTGATLAACARALRAAGSKEVSAVAYARTPGR